MLQTGEDAAHLTIDQLLEDLRDVVWLITCENISQPDIACSLKANTEPFLDHADEISRKMLTRLVSCGNHLEILRETQANDVMALAYDRQQTESDSQPNSVLITSQSVPDMNASLQARVMEGMKRNDQMFENIMIDNGADKSPSGLPAYNRHCIHTGTMPEMRPSNRGFRSIGHGIMRSLRTATVRMPMALHYS